MRKIIVWAGALLIVAGCTKIEPSPIVQEDGTLLYCPNAYNTRHVLTAAREYCAPKAAQPIGYAACPDDPLENGRLFFCGYNPTYDELERKDVTEKAAPVEESVEENTEDVEVQAEEEEPEE